MNMGALAITAASSTKSENSCFDIVKHSSPNSRYIHPPKIQAACTIFFVRSMFPEAML